MSMLHTDNKYPARPNPNPKPLAADLPLACCSCGSDEGRMGYPDPEGRHWCNACVAATMLHADPAQVDQWRRDLPRAPVVQAPRSARRYDLENAETGEREAKPFGVTDVRAFDSFVGFESSGTIPAGMTMTLVARCQTMFQLGAFVVPEDIGPNFLLNDVRIGRDSVVTSENPIPCSVFRPDPEGRCISFAPTGRNGLCQMAQDLSITVTNQRAHSAMFRAVWFGRRIESFDVPGRVQHRGGFEEHFNNG